MEFDLLYPRCPKRTSRGIEGSREGNPRASLSVAPRTFHSTHAHPPDAVTRETETVQQPAESSEQARLSILLTVSHTACCTARHGVGSHAQSPTTECPIPTGKKFARQSRTA